MKLNQLITELQRIQGAEGDIPILFTISTGEDKDGPILFLGEFNVTVTAERDHDTEGMYVRLSSDDQE